MKNKYALYPVRQVPRAELPYNLQKTPHPHEHLNVRGELAFDEQTRFLTIVGSRKCSHYGRMMVDELIRGLQGYPIVLISGLAYGIDSHVHEAALRYNIPTWAIPGSGLGPDFIYPQKHIPLGFEILVQGGTLLSPFESDRKSERWTFPVRNELMAALADLVIVVEATEKSGSLITATHALNFGTLVGAVPGPINLPTSSGTNRLIYDGASPIISSRVILELLGFAPGSNKSELILKSEIIEEQIILDALYQPLSRGDLSCELNLSIALTSQILSQMEIKGLIHESAGLFYRGPR